MRRWALGCVLGIVGVGAACSLLLPERYAVNLPLWGFLFGAEPPAPTVFESRMSLPDGFEIEIFASGLRGARMLRFTPAGDLLVSSPRESSIFLVEPDRDGDGRGDATRTLLAGLNRPHGMDLWEGWLYIAETDAIRRIRLDAATGHVQGELETVVRGLPGGGNHWTRTLRFGPDGWLYVSIGSSCNVCIEKDPRRAALLRYRPDGSGEEIVARGLRNAVGFDWRPDTGELYATDNGRDLLGDDFPPCELDRIEPGAFYGWPFANGDRVPDPDFGKGHEEEIRASVPPVHGFVPHSAPLGIRFYRGTAFPARYRGAAFVALHGSWNRTRKSGYRVVLLEWDPETGAIRESDFLVGFEIDEDVIGRPVDVLDGPDAALYVSDDFAGAVYRVTYTAHRG
ncbi:MAG: PQQ-dependent sugar dehydrogenase [Myxococcota bacterium]